MTSRQILKYLQIVNTCKLTVWYKYINLNVTLILRQNFCLIDNFVYMTEIFYKYLQNGNKMATNTPSIKFPLCKIR